MMTPRELSHLGRFHQPSLAFFMRSRTGRDSSVSTSSDLASLIRPYSKTPYEDIPSIETFLVRTCEIPCLRVKPKQKMDKGYPLCSFNGCAISIGKMTVLSLSMTS